MLVFSWKLSVLELYACTGSSLERRHESREPRRSVRGITARPAEPRQLVRLPVDASRSTLHAVPAADRPRGAQAALHGQQLHDRRRLVLGRPSSQTTAAPPSTTQSRLADEHRLTSCLSHRRRALLAYRLFDRRVHLLRRLRSVRQCDSLAV